MSSILYAGRDPRDIPTYSIGTAAYLLGLPSGTLQKWVAGRPSRKLRNLGVEEAQIPPLIQRPEGAAQLSFINLVEAHVLAAISRRHGIKIRNVSRALDYLRAAFPHLRHPLAEIEFQTDGVDLFLVNLFQQDIDNPINVSQGGQLALRQLIEAHLKRVDRDDSGLPVRLFPFVRNSSAPVEKLLTEPRPVVIDPRVSFGKPVLAGTGIPTETIADRFKAGEGPDELAEDYEREVSEIEEAIRYEMRRQVA